MIHLSLRHSNIKHYYYFELTMNITVKTLSDSELEELKWSYQHLEHPSLAARLSHVIGSPIDSELKLLPKNWYQHLHNTLDSSLRKILDMAITSMGHIPPAKAHDRMHKLMVMGTGALGGFFGTEVNFSGG